MKKYLDKSLKKKSYKVSLQAFIAALQNLINDLLNAIPSFDDTEKA